jgi:hypothetical protein
MLQNALDRQRAIGRNIPPTPAASPAGRIAITVKPEIGMGDKLQFTSLPENYFRATGKKLVDSSRCWIFDHNPYVDRDAEGKVSKSIELWNFGGHKDKWAFKAPRSEGRPGVFVSNAEIWATALGVSVSLNRPRLYAFEDFPYAERELIILHTDGRSHGAMPAHVLEHVVNKYRPTGRLVQVGLNPVMGIGVPHLPTDSLWDLAEIISKASMYIGVDSGPSWIAACYPDVRLKVLRTKPAAHLFEGWVPLDLKNIHSYWDDRCRETFNPSPLDVGFTQSYLRI